MTNEQIIKGLTKMLDDTIEANECGLSNNDFKDDIELLKSALSLIKEQQEKIENLQKELNEENKRCMILANNDKFKEQVIDLMAELVYKRFKPELLLEYGFESKEQFKQYFAELVRKE